MNHHGSSGHHPKSSFKNPPETAWRSFSSSCAINRQLSTTDMHPNSLKSPLLKHVGLFHILGQPLFIWMMRPRQCEVLLRPRLIMKTISYIAKLEMDDYLERNKLHLLLPLLHSRPRLSRWTHNRCCGLLGFLCFRAHFERPPIANFSSYRYFQRLRLISYSHWKNFTHFDNARFFFFSPTVLGGRFPFSLPFWGLMLHRQQVNLFWFAWTGPGSHSGQAGFSALRIYSFILPPAFGTVGDPVSYDIVIYVSESSNDNSPSALEFRWRHTCN